MLQHTDSAIDSQRSLVLELACGAIDAVRGDRLVKHAAAHTAFSAPLEIAAIGKAACAMMAGAHEILEALIHRSLVITRDGYVSADVAKRRNIEVIEAGHPLPTAASLAAGRRLLEWLADGDTRAHMLFLISGGASSLVEVPAAGLDLEALQYINRWLLASGLDIENINRVRRRLSRIKGGGLLQYIRAAETRVWLLSDVRGDDLASIGSGLLYPGTDSGADDLPAAVRAMLEERGLSSSPPPGGHDRRPVPEHRVLGNLRMACEAALAIARQRGCSARLHETELEGDAAQAGRSLAAQLVEAERGIHIWGGETTVKLPANPGRGGRNQHLALAAAMELAGRRDVCLLALGTDGSDGPGEDAGALVDGRTIGRGELAGQDAARALRCADAGSFLEASGDLIATGVTGTNVRDLVIAMKG